MPYHFMPQRTKSKSLLFAKLQKHFGVDPGGLPVLEQTYSFYERANVHLAISELASTADKLPSLTGIVVSEEYSSVSLSKLARPASADNYDVGPVEYVDQELPGEQRLSCVK